MGFPSMLLLAWGAFQPFSIFDKSKLLKGMNSMLGSVETGILTTLLVAACVVALAVVSAEDCLEVCVFAANLGANLACAANVEAEQAKVKTRSKEVYFMI